MSTLLLSLVVLAAPAEPDRAKLVEMISGKPIGMCGNGDPLAIFHRTPHSPATNQLVIALVDDATLTPEQRTAAFITLRNQRQDEAVVTFMRERYAKTRGVERHVAAVVLVDASEKDRELVFRDFDSGELELDYALLNELSKPHPRPPVSRTVIERIKTALKNSNDEYLKVNATNALKVVSK